MQIDLTWSAGILISTCLFRHRIYILKRVALPATGNREPDYMVRWIPDKYSRIILKRLESNTLMQRDVVSYCNFMPAGQVTVLV